MATDTLTSPAMLGSSATTKVYKNFIDGEWVESSTGETFENRNPADTREVVAIFQKSGKDDVNAAVEAAKRTFERWRLVPAPRREAEPGGHLVRPNQAVGNPTNSGKIRPLFRHNWGNSF